jgi:2-oxo-4-hydroxy-4-carboxy-5-ureidoimidazoline decarboxylase
VIDVQSPEGRDRLAAALGVRRWVEEVAAGSPYASVDALVAAGERAAADLSDAELDEAVAHHPRIGQRADGDGTTSRLSQGEQAGLGAADEGLDAALARGNQVYEERFGRVFLIRAAGRSRQEVLDELQRRLKNDAADETEEAKEQLRQIAALRLAALFGEAA